MKKILQNRLTLIIAFILLPFIIELFTFGKIVFDKSMIIRVMFIYGIYALFAIYKILKKYKEKVKKVVNFIVDKRYVFALIAFVVLVVGKINFSSVDIWKSLLGEAQIKDTIIGTPRTIRSDEWMVQTPIMLAQANSKNGYNMHNENVGQGNINLLLTPAVVEDIVSISRPQSWGFLLLGAEYGFSFYWAFKYIGLIMVSIELVLKITNRDKLLSLVGGIVLGLAPAMLWWMSSSVVDAYIFGVAIIVLFSYYMENLNWKLWKKLLIGLGIVICLPGFAFTLYPAYLVPFAFLMAIFMINDFVKHRKELKKQDYFIMGITILLCLGIIVRFVIIAWDGITGIMSTLYPGKRVELGGNIALEKLTSYLMNVFLPYTHIFLNSSELSGYIYPIIGLIVMLCINLKGIKENDKEDKGLIIGLTIFSVILVIWEVIGFPEFLAKITLMYFSPPPRTNLVLQLLGVILSIIIIHVANRKYGKKIENSKAILIGFISVLVSYIAMNNLNLNYKEFFTPIKKEIVAIMVFFMTYFFVRANKKAWCYTMFIVAVIAGATVNPISRGTDILYKTDIAKKIQEIEKEDEDAIWIGNNYTGQYLVANNVETICGNNMYPNFEWIKKLDPEGKYENVYNRYAHISAVLDTKTEFVLKALDSYEVHLTYENLKDLGIKYYYINSEISENIKEDFKLEPKYEDKERNQYIYEIK